MLSINNLRLIDKPCWGERVIFSDRKSIISMKFESSIRLLEFRCFGQLPKSALEWTWCISCG